MQWFCRKSVNSRTAATWKSAFQYAIANESTPSLQYMLDQKLVTLDDALLHAMCDNAATLEFAIARGIHTKFTTQHWNRVLLFACTHNARETAALAVQRGGCDLHYQNALNRACYHGHCELTKWIVYRLPRVDLDLTDALSYASLGYLQYLTHAAASDPGRETKQNAYTGIMHWLLDRDATQCDATVQSAAAGGHLLLLHRLNPHPIQELELQDRGNSAPQ